MKKIISVHRGKSSFNHTYSLFQILLMMYGILLCLGVSVDAFVEVSKKPQSFEDTHSLTGQVFANQTLNNVLRLLAVESDTNTCLIEPFEMDEEQLTGYVVDSSTHGSVFYTNFIPQFLPPSIWDQLEKALVQFVDSQLAQGYVPIAAEVHDYQPSVRLKVFLNSRYAMLKDGIVSGNSEIPVFYSHVLDEHAFRLHQTYYRENSTQHIPYQKPHNVIGLEDWDVLLLSRIAQSFASDSLESQASFLIQLAVSSLVDDSKRRLLFGSIFSFKKRVPDSGQYGSLLSDVSMYILENRNLSVADIYETWTQMVHLIERAFLQNFNLKFFQLNQLFGFFLSERIEKSKGPLFFKQNAPMRLLHSQLSDLKACFVGTSCNESLSFKEVFLVSTQARESVGWLPEIHRHLEPLATDTSTVSEFSSTLSKKHMVKKVPPFFLSVGTLHTIPKGTLMSNLSHHGLIDPAVSTLPRVFPYMHLNAFVGLNTPLN